MKLTFLGTGTSQGVPVIGCDCDICTSSDLRDKRLRSSVLVEYDKTTLIVDTGPDFRQQMLRENVLNLDAALFTHAHKDHTAGLDDIRAFNFKWRKSIDIYATEPTFGQLKQEFSYIFYKNDYPGAAQLVPHLIDEKPFIIAGLKIVPIPVMHHSMPVRGFRFGDLAYITDANFIPDTSLEKLKGLKVLVLNALRKRSHRSHFTLEQAIEMAQKINAERTYFIHMSHWMGKHEETNKTLPSGIELSYDGMQIEV